MPIGNGWVACWKQPVGRDERERARQIQNSVERVVGKRGGFGLIYKYEHFDCSHGDAAEAFCPNGEGSRSRIPALRNQRL